MFLVNNYECIKTLIKPTIKANQSMHNKKMKKLKKYMKKSMDRKSKSINFS